MKSTLDEILQQVQAGVLTVEEGAQRIQRMDDAANGDQPEAGAPVGKHETASRYDFEDKASEEQINRWRSWWLYPFWGGLVVFLFSSTIMAWSYTNERYFWFACAWLPLLFGLTVLTLAAWSRTARWLHLRINDPGKHGSKPTRIAISVPVPIFLAGWGLRLFGHRIPNYKEMNLDMVVPFLDSLAENHDAISVEVNEDDGERVQVYIV